MLIVAGHKYDYDFIRNVNCPCPECGESPCGLYFARKRLTMYWIPTFTMGREYALKCTHCSKDKHWSIDEATGMRLTTEELQCEPSDMRWMVDAARHQLHLELPGDATTSAPAAVVAPSPPTPTGAAESATTPCAKCGEQLPPGARFCSGCGAPAPQPRACPACGHQQSSGKFCSHCGAKMSE